MKVQIFEQFHAGHYTNYIEHLLPALIRLIEKKLIEKIIVTITPTHLHSRAFQEQLAEYSDWVEFDASLYEIGDTLTRFNPQRILKNPAQAFSALGAT